MSIRRLEIKSYGVWKGLVIDRALWEGPTSVGSSKILIINNLISAQMVMNVSAELWPCTVIITMNGTVLQQFDFSLGPGAGTATVNVTNILFSGDNAFKVEVLKNPFVGWGKVHIDANLVIDGDVIPGPTLPDWWPWAAAGGMVILALLYKRRKKAQPIMVYANRRNNH